MTVDSQTAASPNKTASPFNPYDLVPLVAIALLIAGYLLFRGATAGTGRYTWGKDILMPLGNFVLFLYLLLSKVVPALQKHLKERRQTIAEGIETFDQKSQRISSQFTDIKEKLAHVDEETAGILQKAQDHAQTAKDKLVTQAQAQAKRIRDNALVLAQHERHQILQNLRVQLVEQSFARAQEMLQQHINEDDQHRLQREHLEMMPKMFDASQSSQAS